LREIISSAPSVAGTVLVVRLEKDLYAIPIAAVEEVLPALPIEPLPGCPAFVRGVVFVRGHLIPVLAAAERLGLEGHRRPDEPHIVCLRTTNRLVGVEFDEALDLVEIRSGALLPADEVSGAGRFFRGLVEQDGAILRLLDPEKLIAREEE
jgi:purine-binding chemotaxis protein CheW